MKKGDIYLVNFDPSIGKEFQKMRPGLIIQSQNIQSSLITIIPISSQIQNREKNDILISKNLKNRLFSNSIIKVRQISSFDKKRFIHFIGQANEEIVKKTNSYLLKHFDIHNSLLI